ncbi:hypothetical protein Ddye_008832 [Dipteronia dyeriana]|uniref:VQ domain-containing protein n=1 Tax=Dipteronia dyeriana TaxID=168575 RepID=A0AAE0CLP4_9ROSI|nr:hypothetical protein Ddye_008832 [Dipteronia dyeriana]
MDSANSTGSLQSSSTGAGDEESYDSRADSPSISAFFNNVGPMSNLHSSSSSSMFDHQQYPLSNYLDPANNITLSARSNPTNSLLNFDMVWSKNLRSDPNCTDFVVGGGGFMASSTSSSASQQPLLANQITALQNRTTANTFAHFPPPGGGGADIDQQQPNNNNSNTNTVRNPKKRSRASRRAPTTVLTTDTTNFRAMVQEFTGIPAPPFTSTSSTPFPMNIRTRLDLFGGLPSSFIRSSSNPSPPPYLLRPFAHKIQPQPLPFVNISTTSMTVDASTAPEAATATNVTPGSSRNGNNVNNSNSTSINYQQFSGSSPPPNQQHHQNLLNMNMQLQNPIFNLHSLLQAPTKPPPQQPQDHNDLKISVLEELGLSSHGGGGGGGGHLNVLQSMVSSSSSPPPPPPSSAVGTLSVAAMRNNNNHTMITNNFLASSISDFNGDHHKVLQENVGATTTTTTRTEGIVESWICSSD